MSNTIKDDKTATGDIMYAFSILALEQHSKKGNFAMVKHQPRMIKEHLKCLAKETKF